MIRSSMSFTGFLSMRARHQGQGVRRLVSWNAVALHLAAALLLPPLALNAEPNPPVGRLFGDEIVDVESKFFEVPEAIAIQLGLVNMPEAGGKGDGAVNPATTDAANSFSSVLAPASVATLLQKLNAARGVKLLSSPRVSVRSRQRAVMEIVREFRYGTEFDFDKGAALFIPKAFETRNLGISLEVEPSVSDDLIQLNLVPQLVELEGFMRASDSQPVALRGGRNVGADLNLEDLAAVQIPKDTVLIPIFSSRKLQTAVALASGQTVVLGGLKRDNQEDGKPPNPRYLYIVVTAKVLNRSLSEVLPVATINPGDGAGFVRSPFAPDAKPIDARDLPAGTELKCPVTRKLFRLP